MNTLSPHEQNDKSTTSWSRICPECGKILFYASKQVMQRQEKNNALCRPCYGRYKPDTHLAQQIIKAHSQGLGNREIAKYIGCHHRTVNYHLKKAELTTNNPRGKPPIETGPDTAICSYCGKEVLKTEFALVRSYEDARRLSKCRMCRKKDGYTRLSTDINAFLRNKEVRHRTQAKSRGIFYGLPRGYASELYRKQKGLCFYTDTPLITVAGQGRNPHSLSIDRVDSRRGYVSDNVVLCTDRVNNIKKDVTPEEMRQWMPGWYERVMAEVKSGRLIIQEW